MIRFTGATSGCRADYLAPVPDSGFAQPLLDTSQPYGGVMPQTTQNTGNREGAVYPPVPHGASTFPTDLSSNMGSTDQMQTDKLMSVAPGPHDPFAEPIRGIFRGSPDRGSKGGPA